MSAEALHRMCFGKKRYPAEKLAKQVAHKAAEARSVRLRIYACPICGGWHLTHKEKKC